MSKHNPFADLKALRQSAEVVDFPPAKASSRAKRSRRLVAFPWAFLVDACSLTTGRTALLVAEYIYRRTYVCGSLTVSLPSAELAELRISRRVKTKALAQLAAAGLIRIERTARGRTAKVTLLWHER